jgi:hypothetical protein
MNTASRKRNNRRASTQLGWPPATARAEVEYTCAWLIEASSRASTFEALRRGFPGRALPDASGTSWLAVLCAVLGNPEPGLTQTGAERVVLPRPISGEPLSELVDEDSLLAGDAACRQEASEFGGTGDIPRSGGGATVAPPSRANGKTREQGAPGVAGPDSCTSLEGASGLRRLAKDPDQPAALPDRGAVELVGDRCGGAGACWAGRRPTAGIRDAETPTGLEHLAAKVLVRVCAGQERLKHPHDARTPAAVAMTLGASALTWDEFAATAMAGVLGGRRRA